MEGRMAVCNMSIEGGARASPDRPRRRDNREYITQGERPFAHRGATLDAAIADWKALRTDDPSAFDRLQSRSTPSELVPQVTWGTNPAAWSTLTGVVPRPEEVPFASVDDARLALGVHARTRARYADQRSPRRRGFLSARAPTARIEDLRATAKVFKGRKTAPACRRHGRARQQATPVRHQAEAEGLDRIFTRGRRLSGGRRVAACVAMNPDKLKSGQRLGQHQQPQLRGRQGPRRTHPPGQPGHGRRRRRRRALHGRPPASCHNLRESRIMEPFVTSTMGAWPCSTGATSTPI